MGDLINFNRARKERAKMAAAQKAADNRAKFGMTKAEKKKLAEEKAKLERHVEGHRLSPDTPET
jgi:ribosomal protein S2